MVRRFLYDLSIGFPKDLQSTKVFTQTEQSKVIVEQTAANNGDEYRVISVEEQNQREGNVAREKNVTTLISMEEQNMVENSATQQGFVPQENGSGFFFARVK
ncbi:hypothetical protein [Neobacillus niacini]|uniref:hypothetical protein n=1 Tax=Neobacillus niacini TaxID=86668 RepID=UPI003983288D